MSKKAMKDEVCVMAAAGMLGGSFDLTAFNTALQYNPDVIGCDSGTCDSGPFFLGAGVPRMSRKGVKRDLEVMIDAGLKRNIPVLVGSAGTAGADPNVDWMVEIVEEIAQEKGLHFKLAVIKTEITKEQLKSYMNAGKMHPLEGAPEFTEKDLDKLKRVVTVMGAEPFIEAMENGAQVVIAGRSTDTSIYAAVPMMYGIDNGFVWHAAKVLECGSLASVMDKHHGAMLAWIRHDSASIEPGHPESVVSPNSVVSHTLYENDNPFSFVEPGHRINTKDSVYTPDNERRVRITNTRMEKLPYTIKLEGVKFEGYRRVAIAGVSDPLILKQFDNWVENVEKHSKIRIQLGLKLTPNDYRMRVVRYGNPNDPETERVGLLFDIVASSPEDADAIIASIWHTALHVPIPEYIGAQSQSAFPFSPPSLQTLSNGETYSYCLNHVINVDDPLETVRISYKDL